MVIHKHLGQYRARGSTENKTLGGQYRARGNMETLLEGGGIRRGAHFRAVPMGTLPP